MKETEQRIERGGRGGRGGVGQCQERKGDRARGNEEKERRREEGDVGGKVRRRGRTE